MTPPFNFMYRYLRTFEGHGYCPRCEAEIQVYDAEIEAKPCSCPLTPAEEEEIVHRAAESFYVEE